jgi:hypothetical protein
MAVSKDSRSTLFAVELHSPDPERLVRFYEQAISVQFTSTTFPLPAYVAELGTGALIISKLPDNASQTVTLMVMSQNAKLPEGERYFLFPPRPLCGLLFERYASRVQDPDGNHVAAVASMENVFGQISTVSTFRGLLRAAREYGLVCLDRFRRKVRSWKDELLDWYEYKANRVTLVHRNISQFTHIVASREGLFVVNSKSYQRVLRGRFFGTTIKDGAIYCFQSCGKEEADKGRLLKISMSSGKISSIDVIAKGLDDGCHQIDFVGEDLLVVDCYNGRILQIKPGVPGHKAHYPLGELSRSVARDEYHMNSLAAHPDGTLWLLLHNTAKKHSEVVVLDSQFQVVRRFFVDAGSAHNIVFTNDTAEYLIADSSRGRVITSQGVVVDTGLMMLRGISLDEQSCVVGDSFFATRLFRRYVPGRVHFFDRATWKCTSSLSIPAAPTEIRRIDGKDFSISNYCLSNCYATRPDAPEVIGAY